MFNKLTKKYLKEFIKILLDIIGIFLYAIGLKWFVINANILPAGFTGLSTMLTRILNDNFHILIPMSVFNIAFNIIPAYFSFKIVGKAFTIKSFIVMFAFSFIADYIPVKQLTTDPLLASVFGGILCGFGCSLWFRCGISGGGTDFIAMSLSATYHISTFGYIMAFNIILILIQAFIYGPESAFFSIIFQYVSTTAINQSYRHYEARTLFIITEKPTVVSKTLIKETGHSCTRFDGIGCYTNNEKYLLYTVVTHPEVKKVTSIIKKCDPSAFINIMKSNEVQGNFKYLPVSIDDIEENL